MHVVYKNSEDSFYRLAKFNFLTFKKGKYIGMVSVLALGSVLLLFLIGYFAFIFTVMAAAYVPLSLFLAKNKVKRAFAKNPAFGELTYHYTFDEEKEEDFFVTVTRTEKSKGKIKTKKKDTVVPYYTVLRACKDKDCIYLYFSESTVILPLDAIEGGTAQALEVLLRKRIGKRFTTGKIDIAAYKEELKQKFSKEKQENASDVTESETEQKQEDTASSSQPLLQQETTLPSGEEKE